jgi:hypothetical protein
MFSGSQSHQGKSQEPCTSRREAVGPSGTAHNPWREAMQERVMRYIRMLRAMWRGLETELRRLLHGHPRGNPRHGQGAAYG